MAFGLCFGLEYGFKLIFGLKEDSVLVQAVLRPLTLAHASEFQQNLVCNAPCLAPNGLKHSVRLVLAS